MQPTDANFKDYHGADAAPDNDTDPAIGAINLSTGLISDENTVNGGAFGLNIYQPTSGTDYYYGGLYRRMESSAPTSYANPRAFLRNGALLNSLSGIPQVVSTSSDDVGVAGNAAGVGLQVVCVAKVGGVWTPQYINPNGTSFSSNVAGGVQATDANTVWRWELLQDGSPTFFKGALGCFIGGQLVCVLRGTLDPRRSIPGQGTYMGTAELKLAVASAKNSTIACADRRTAPTGVGSFSRAVLFGSNGSTWTGSDQSINLPGGPWAANDYCGYALEFSSVAGIPAPVGSFYADVAFVGRPGT